MRGQGISSNYPIQASCRLHSKKSVSVFSSDRGAIRDRYVAISVTNGNLIHFFAVFMLFHFCIFSRFEDTLVSYHVTVSCWVSESIHDAFNCS